MKREFVLLCTGKNYDTIKNIAKGFAQDKLFGNAERKIVFGKNISEEKIEHYYTRIRFKCTKRRLSECRNTLNDLVNAGLLLSSTEIW